MTALHLIVESIDWQCLAGFGLFELLCLWLLWVGSDRTSSALPPPDMRCIARGEPMHYVRHDAWDVGPARVLSDNNQGP